MYSQPEPINKPVVQERKLRRSHSKLVAFLFCLVISILMWLFIELMKEYNDEITYNISFINAPKDLILTNSGDSVLVIGMHAQGFELLAAKYATKRRTLNIDLSALRIRHTSEGYTAYLPSSRLVDQLVNQIRFKKEITFIKPDTLFFRFSDIYHKQVPVKPDVSYTVNGQYDVTDSMSFRPYFVTVSSIKSIIDTLAFVKTAKLRLNNLDSSVSIKVPLVKGPHWRLIKYSNDSVTVKLDVEKITESSYNIPVSINSDGSNVKIFPDKVEVIFRVPLSVYPHLERSDFQAEVDYPSLSNENKKLKVKLVKLPEKVKILKILPEEVEYIVISK